MRDRRCLYLVLLAALALVLLAGWRGGIAIEERVLARARGAGISLRAVEFSWFGPLRLVEVARPLPAGGRLTVEEIRLGWRFLGTTDPRTHLSQIALRGVRLER